jgi:hypothetical protein
MGGGSTASASKTEEEETALVAQEQEEKQEVKKSFQASFQEACVRGMSPTAAAVDAIRRHGTRARAASMGCQPCARNSGQDSRFAAAPARSRKCNPCLDTPTLGSCVDIGMSQQLLLYETVTSPTYLLESTAL